MVIMRSTFSHSFIDFVPDKCSTSHLIYFCPQVEAMAQNIAEMQSAADTHTRTLKEAKVTD